MNPNHVPSKSALKRKYGISNDDFQILTRDTTPSAEELGKSGHIIERVADWFGVPTYIVRAGTALATVVAVLFIPAHMKTFQDNLNESLKYYSGMIQPFRNLPEPNKNLPDMYFSHANIANTTTSVVTYMITPPPGGV